MNDNKTIGKVFSKKNSISILPFTQADLAGAYRFGRVGFIKQVAILTKGKEDANNDKKQDTK